MAALPVTRAAVAAEFPDPATPLAAITTPVFDTKNPPSGARTFRVTYRGATDDVVPALLTVPGDGVRARRYPAVVLVHGLGGRKEDTLLLSLALARRGYASLAIDLPGHGGRKLPPGISSFADLSLAQFDALGIATVTDLRRGVDFLQTRPNIDAHRIGCIGISLGGIFGGVFAGVEPRITCVALWSAGGDWGKLFAESDHPLAVRRRRKDPGVSAAETEAALTDIDPLRYAAKIAPRPLLLLTGDQDTIVPSDCSDELFAAAGEPKVRKRFTGGHLPDLRAMTMDTMAFLDAHL